MPQRAHRRVRLPPDDRSPARARALVRDVLLEAGWADRLDEALLLVSELSTNGVMHAGTALDVDVRADPEAVTVTVSDQKGGLVGAPDYADPESLLAFSVDGEAELERLDEYGRGLLLVDHIASAWGTTHHRAGKDVWFRLDRAGGSGTEPVRVAGPSSLAQPPTGPTAPPQPAPPASRLPVEPTITPAIFSWLVHVPDELRARLMLPELVSELLARLCEVTRAASGAVWLDEADGRGETLLAWHGTGPPPPAAAADAEPSRMVVPLPVHRPLHGTLVLQPVAGRAPGGSWAALAALSAQRMALGIDAERLRQADQRRRGWLLFLAEASVLLAQSLDVKLTIALVPQIVVPRLGDWCVVHTLEPDRQLRLAAAAHADEAALSKVKQRLGQGPPAAALHALARGVTEDATVSLPAPTEGLAVRLAARGHVIGTLSVGPRVRRALHGPDDIAVIEDIARRASLAIDNARVHAERDHVAQDLQFALLPARLPEVPWLEFGAEYVPVSHGTEVGGDFYDVAQIRRNRWLASIGDVCGKGTQAAAVTGVVRDVVRAFVRDNRSLRHTMRALNRTLLEQHDPSRYCTVATALITRAVAGDGTPILDVLLCLAGHDQPVLVRSDGTAKPVGEYGTAIGLLDEIQVAEVPVTLRPDDALVFFTDGVSERRRGREMYGSRRVRHQLRALAGHRAPAIARGLRAAVLEFSPEPPRDDIAVLVVRNPG